MHRGKKTKNMEFTEVFNFFETFWSCGSSICSFLKSDISLSARKNGIWWVVVSGIQTKAWAKVKKLGEAKQDFFIVTFFARWFCRPKCWRPTQDQDQNQKWFIQFKNFWQFYEFGINILLKCLSICCSSLFVSLCVLGEKPNPNSPFQKYDIDSFHNKIDGLFQASDNIFREAQHGRNHWSLLERSCLYLILCPKRKNSCLSFICKTRKMKLRHF